MNAVIHFLKPNKWKVGIWITISIVALVIGALGMVTEGRFLVQFGIPTYLTSPLLLFWLFVAIPGVMASANIFNNVFALVPYGLAYWYLLSCLIYFVFMKIKNKSTGH